MRVLINGQSLQSPSTRNRGIGRYTRNLIIGLCEVRPDWQWTLLEVGHLAPADRELLPERLIYRIYHAPLPVDGSNRRSRWMIDRHHADWLMHQSADLLLTPCLFEGDGVQPEFIRSRLPHVAVLHDLIPVIYPEFNLRDRVWNDHYTDRLQLLREVDLTLAISECTAQDFRRLMPTARPPVFNITGTTDAHFATLEPSALTEYDQLFREKFQLTRPFIFNGGGDCWRKNMSGVLEGYSRLSPEQLEMFDLVIGCGIAQHDKIALQERAAELGLSERLHLTGVVSDQELRALYQLCRVFLFPSLYEGLGLPLVEAMRCGAPVVTSKRSSMPEYGGPWSWYADPLDPESITESLATALDEPRELYEKERIAFASSFSAPRMAEIVCCLLESRAWETLPHRERVAWITPIKDGQSLSPEWLQVLKALSRDYVIDLVSDAETQDYLSQLQCHYPIIRAADFPARCSLFEYAERIYHLRVDSSTSETVRLMRWLPGIVLVTEEFVADPSHPLSVVLPWARCVVTTSPRVWQQLRASRTVPVVYVPAPRVSIADNALSVAGLPPSLVARRFKTIIDQSKTGVGVTPLTLDRVG